LGGYEPNKKFKKDPCRGKSETHTLKRPSGGVHLAKPSKPSQPPSHGRKKTELQKGGGDNEGTFQSFAEMGANVNSTTENCVLGGKHAGNGSGKKR